MIRVAIIEDNEIIRDDVTDLLNKRLFDFEVDYKVSKFDSSEQFLNKADRGKFQIVILDIELPGKNGVDLAKELHHMKSDAIIVFLTSYEGYMKDAFGVNVHRYILKSEYERVLPVVIGDLISMLLDRQEITFRTPNGIVKLASDDIAYIELEERNPYVMTRLNENIKLSSTSLKSIYKNIDSNKYLYVNNHTIVNMKHIVSFNARCIKMRNSSEEFIVSRGKKREIYKKYTDFLMNGDTL